MEVRTSVKRTLLTSCSQVHTLLVNNSIQSLRLWMFQSRADRNPRAMFAHLLRGMSLLFFLFAAIAIASHKQSCYFSLQGISHVMSAIESHQQDQQLFEKLVAARSQIYAEL